LKKKLPSRNFFFNINEMTTLQHRSIFYNKTMSKNSIPGTPELADETLIAIAEAGKAFPVAVSKSNVERMVRNGTRGVQLETILIGYRRYTSKEAIRRFIERTQGKKTKTQSPPRQSLSQAKIEELRKKYNMPESGYTPPIG
jgi:hypothetical protein